MLNEQLPANLVGKMLKTSQSVVDLVARRYPEVLFSVNTDEKVIALTIDDGPHPEVTPQILDVLALHDVQANFFLIGERVVGNEKLVERMVAEGHEIGNHMYEDARSIALPEEQFEEQLEKTHALLAAIGPVRWFRPGSGLFNRKMLNRIAQRGYRLVLGSVYPYDAQVGSVSFSNWYIRNSVRPGSIIVLHDGTTERGRIITVLQNILPLLKNQGYRFVTLSEISQLEKPKDKQ